MDIGLGDKVKDKSGPTKGTVIAITHWAAENDKPERWDIGVRPAGTDRITWLDSDTVQVTKAA